MGGRLERRKVFFFPNDRTRCTVLIIKSNYNPIDHLKRVMEVGRRLGKEIELNERVVVKGERGEREERRGGIGAVV